MNNPNNVRRRPGYPRALMSVEVENLQGRDDGTNESLVINDRQSRNQLTQYPCFCAA